MEIEIVKAVQSIANSFFDVFFRVVTYAGSFFAFLFVVFLFFLLCDKKYTVFMSIAFVISWGVNEIAKLIIARPRPFMMSSEIIQKVSASNYSMPSGHSFAVAFLIGMIIYYVCKNSKKTTTIITSISLTVIGLLVGLSRIYLGVHFLSDVLVGFTYGIVCVIMSIVLYKKILLKRKNKKDTYGTQNTIK